jgi:tellurite resistance protein
MTETMTTQERDELIAAMRNHTEMGRFNHDTIAAIFDRLVSLGYDIVKRSPDPAPAAKEATKPDKKPVKHQ